jgi:O-antigen/teichoic acid export membrane protein
MAEILAIRPHLAAMHDVNAFAQGLNQANQVLVPTVSHLQERDPKLIPVVYRESYRLIFFLAVPIFASAAVLSPLVSRIWIGRYEPIFVDFVAILAAGWLVNVLTNPAYVVDLGTGALKWVSVGCLSAAMLNAGLGFVAGALFGGIGVVAATALSQAMGYIIVLVAYHLENRIAFRQLLPSESRAVLLTSSLGAAALLPMFGAAYRRSRFSFGIAETVLGMLIITIVTLMWRHPMRKRLIRWLYDQVLT